MNTRRRLPAHAGLLLLALAIPALAACRGGGATPSPAPSAGPTPTPIAVRVTKPEEAAALVLASDPQFAGIGKQNPDLIGASAWWTADPIADGAFRITITKGWGDCPAGCINKHLWIFEVSADGQVNLVDESGDPLPG